MWATIKKAINGKVGRLNLKPLDEIITDNNYNNFYKISELIQSYLAPETTKEIVFVKEGKNTIEIPDFAFNTTVKRIILPSSVKTILTGSFMGCTNLEKIYINNGVEEIPDGCFQECAALQKISLPSSIKKIGSKIATLSRLETIFINSYSNINISADAFEGATLLQEIYVPWKYGEVPGAPWGAPSSSVKVIYEWSGE